MTTLSIFQLPHTAQPVEQLAAFDDIAELLAGAGIQLERWEIGSLPATADDDTLLSHFQQDIERLKRQEGYTAADVIRITPDHPDKQALRETFLREHTHSEDEVRFFDTGSGTFFVPLGDKVFRLTCEAGDLLRVPANIRHWFDCGAQPDFTAIRIFTNPAGWVGHFTGQETFYLVCVEQHTLTKKTFQLVRNVNATRQSSVAFSDSNTPPFTLLLTKPLQANLK